MQTLVHMQEEDLAVLEKGLSRYPKGAKKVLTRAVNKVTSRTRTKISREVRKRLNVRAKTVNKSVTATRARFSSPTATIKIRGSRLGLLDFIGTSQTRRGVAYRIKRGAARETIKGGFIQRMPNGHRGAFVRTSKSRLPIVALRGPSIPAAVAGIRTLAKRQVERDVSADLSNEIGVQVGVLIDQESRRGRR